MEEEGGTRCLTIVIRLSCRSYNRVILILSFRPNIDFFHLFGYDSFLAIVSQTRTTDSCRKFSNSIIRTVSKLVIFPSSDCSSLLDLHLDRSVFIVNYFIIRERKGGETRKETTLRRGLFVGRGESAARGNGV